MNGASTGLMQAQELVDALDSDSSLFVLDVREPDEWLDWKIPGAVNIPLGQLPSRLGEVPESAHVVVVCAKGSRADEGAKVLAAQGRASRVLAGGMGSWASTYDYVEGDFAGAVVVQLRRRGKGCLSYVIGAGERCVVIDPSLDLSHYLDVATSHNWRITDVLDTHLHADHLSGARALVEATGATLRLSAADPFTYEFTPLEDGQLITLSDGVGLGVSAVSVPGHTEGSTLYTLSDAAVFTGDTLFLESVGRPDLADQAEAFAHLLYRSLHERVLPMGDQVMVFPAHYGASVPVHVGTFVARPLGELSRNLPALAFSEANFVEWAVENVKDRPPNYQKIVQVNAGSEELSDDVHELELGPNRCAIA